MVTRSGRRRRVVAAVLAPTALAVLVAPGALADPEVPAEPQPPLVTPAEPAPAAAPLAVTAPDGAPVAAAVLPADGVPHLPSPDSPPPGTTTAPNEGKTLGYLRDLWHAVQTQDVTMSDALLLFAQRPMDAKTPLHSMTPQPQQIVPGTAVADPAAAVPTAPAPAGPEAPAQPGPPVSAEANVPQAEAQPAPPPLP